MTYEFKHQKCELDELAKTIAFWQELGWEYVAHGVFTKASKTSYSTIFCASIIFRRLVNGADHKNQD